jgi:branched-chain amino acid transport system ATP-binding protein
MLRVRQLSGGYGRIVAIRSIDIEVGEGELVAVIGRNGAGKSTLLKTISGVQPSFFGTLSLGDTDLTYLNAPARVQAGLAHVPEGRQVFGTLSVEDNLRLGASYRSHEETESSLQEQFALFPVLRERRETLAEG